MFISNKYTKWYNNIISHRQQNIIDNGENHHIIPKSLGGSNNSENIVKLSYKEHFICHLLLTKMCDTLDSTIKMVWALHKLTFSGKKITSKDYELTRRIWIKFLKTNHHAHRIPGWNEKMSNLIFESWKDNEDRRLQQSEKMKARYIADKESWDEHLRSISKKGAQASREKLSLDIEYNGITYRGWNDLKNNTGISKHLYKKYYVNGIDPTSRIGANGPIRNQIGESAYV